MVRGLDVFRDFFAGNADQFALIGGTAATIAMESAGLTFRATKDLDIVLHIEALNRAFGRTFWAFVEQGHYEIRQASQTGRPVLYRFQRPADTRFPAMLELFCRSPDGIELNAGAHLRPIPVGEAVASLSAILLDNDYYRFIITGRKTVDQLPRIGAEQLIPLKARAWLDLSGRKANGEPVDTRDIRKHANDVLRLSQLLAPESRIDLATRIRDDLAQFLDGVGADGSHDPKALQISGTTDEILARIARAYGVVQPGG
ncbi:MAG: hypothetical protein ACYDAE_19820 [Steroidobacteraceae bacterium]